MESMAGNEESVSFSTIKLPNVTRDQGGEYFCYIEDANGVISVPQAGSLHERDPGLVHVHVRPNWYFAIPAGGAIIILFLVAVVVNFCPDCKCHHY